MERAVRALSAFYGPIPSPPHELFAFVVWDVISRRSVPARRDHAWQALKRIPALTPDALFRAPKAALEAALEGLGGGDRLDALREIGGHFRRHRDLAARVSRSLLAGSRALADVPQLSLAARLTAPLLVGGHVVAAIDDGVARVVARLHGMERQGDRRRRRRARRVLEAQCGPHRDALARAVVVLGHHALHACLEQSPHCAVCPLRPDCAHAAAGAAGA